MTIEQQAREWHRKQYPFMHTTLVDQVTRNKNDTDILDLAAFARHLSSQAPGNLSEETEASLREAWKLPTPNQVSNEYRAIHQGNRHYLSGWVAVSIPPKFKKYYWVLLDKIPMWGTTDADRVMMYWYRGDGHWADQHGDDLMDISDHITHYAEAVPPLPIPPYTPQQEQR